jgi:predicted Zn-dependent protease
MNRLERAFEIALRDALPAQRAAESTARASRLTADYIGLRVLARSGRSPRALRAIVQDIVASL